MNKKIILISSFILLLINIVNSQVVYGQYLDQDTSNKLQELVNTCSIGNDSINSHFCEQFAKKTNYNDLLEVKIKSGNTSVSDYYNAYTEAVNTLSDQIVKQFLIEDLK